MIKITEVLLLISKQVNSGEFILEGTEGVDK
jgi:hypothetical protein